MDNDPIYVEGDEEVEKIIVEVQEDEEEEEDMEDKTEAEKDENDSFSSSSDSSKENEKASREVQKKTLAKGMKKTAVNEGPSIELGASIPVGGFVGENIMGPEVQSARNVPTIEIRVCSVKHVDTKMREDVYMTLREIPISLVNEVHTEVGDGNEGFTSMNVDFTIAMPSTKDVTTSRLATEPHLSRMEMAWASQDQGMTEREDGYFL